VALQLAHGTPRLAGRNEFVLSKIALAPGTFPEVPIGEDTRFVWQSAVRRLADIREENAWSDWCILPILPKTGRGAYWVQAGISEVTRCLGTDVEFYDGLGRTPQVASAVSGSPSPRSTAGGDS
jgi:hypothetical protein